MFSLKFDLLFPSIDLAKATARAIEYGIEAARQSLRAA